VRRAPLVLATAAAAVGLAACGGTQELNPKGEEQFIRQHLSPTILAHIKTISCPSGFPPAKGEPYKCKIVATDGSTAHVQGVQLDDQGHLGDLQLVK
jgi:Domain of unknown function (DUF4333)